MLDSRLGQMYVTVVSFTDKKMGRELLEVKGGTLDTK